MENQHRKITGYSELNEAEIKAINAVKELSEAVGVLVEELQSEPGSDQHWVSIGQTNLQLGFMALTRAVAKPTTF